MLKEFIDTIAGHVKAGEYPKLTTYDPRLNLVYLDGGKYVFRPASRGPARNHVANDLLSFVDMARWAASGDLVNMPLVFVSLESVVFYYDSVDRQDSITVNLPLSQQYTTLQKINKKLLAQKELVKHLRIDLDGTLANQDATIDKFSAVKWSTEDSSESVVARGKASLGKQITQQFTGVAETPDTLVFNVPIYESKFNAKANLKFDVDPDVTSRGFVLTAYPSQFANAENEATKGVFKTLVELLKDSETLVVVGSESP